MIDAELMPPAGRGSVATKAELLGGLCSHELIELYRYAEGGPPREEWPDSTEPEALAGWVIVREQAPSVWSVTYKTDANSITTSGVSGDAVEMTAADVHSTAYGDLSPEEAAARRLADGLACQVAAQALYVDIYVTTRPYLHNPTWNLAGGVTVCHPEDALPIVGLYLRAQGSFLVAHNFTFNRGLWYWVGTRDLLPSSWRWFAACVRHSTSMGDHRLTILGGSLLQRVDRALEARDAIHLALNQPQNNDTQDEALSQLDITLLFLMGAVDAAARVAHVVLGLDPSDLHRAAWQNRRPGGWLDKVRSKEEALASVIDPTVPGGHTLSILRLLRNSVHGAALQGLSVRTRFAPVESLVGLPETDAAALLLAMDELGGREAWGARPELAGRFHVDPGIFADRLFDAVLALLNDLMAATPVERLPGVRLTAEDLGPPSDDRRDRTWKQSTRTSIRWQLGF